MNEQTNKFNNIDKSAVPQAEYSFACWFLDASKNLGLVYYWVVMMSCWFTNVFKDLGLDINAFFP